ncbi:MAG: SWIM zinc finger family protein [Bacteroidota bacterium]
MKWSAEYILSLAPTPSTAKRGETLSTTRKWRQLGGSPRAIWGMCQSSGKGYYHTQVDLQGGPAYKCTCPSRQFPCKHVIGLLLIYVQQSEAFYVTEDYPDWVRQWLEGRQVKAESSEKAAEKAVAKAKTRDKRMIQMAGGLEDLETWLTDLLRQGMAETEKQDPQFWNDFASRMVDMRLGGVGRRIRELPAMQRSQGEWPEKMLTALGELFLLCKGFSQLDSLSPELQKELLTVAGINIRKEEVLQQEALEDDWLVLGVLEENQEHLNSRKVWLQGQKSKKMALLLDYVHQSANFLDHYKVGGAFSGRVSFYPSAYPLRVLLHEKRPLSLHIGELEGHPNIESFLGAYAAALAANPWQQGFPVLLGPVRPSLHQEQLYLIDDKQQAISVAHNGQSWWQLLALSGGHPITVFGEWNGQQLFIESVSTKDKLVPIG